jgi:hypothetical protein
MSEWMAIVAASGLTKNTHVVRMLKTDYGLAHGAAHRVSLVAAPDEAKPPAGFLAGGLGPWPPGTPGTAVPSGHRDTGVPVGPTNESGSLPVLPGREWHPLV